MAMFNPPHPGGLIAEYLEDNDISLRSPEMAVRLEAGLGIAARLWLSMQAACDLHKARETTDVSGVPLHPGIVASLLRDETV